MESALAQAIPALDTLPDELIEDQAKLVAWLLAVAKELSAMSADEYHDFMVNQL